MAREFDVNNLNELRDTESNEARTEDDQLRIFSNTQFYDLDIGQPTDIGCTVDELLMQQEKEIHFAGKPQPGSSEDSTQMFAFDELQQFSLAGDIPGFQFAREDTTPAQMHTAHRQHWYKQHQHQHQVDLYPAQPQPHVEERGLHLQAEPIRELRQPQTVQTPQPQPQPIVQPIMKPETPRQDAEEDKRRRNTAASARFRIKKKLKEQEMERNTKQMQSRIDDLEAKIRQLEMENKWLKNLVVQRNDKRDTTSLEQLRADLLKTEKS